MDKKRFLIAVDPEVHEALDELAWKSKLSLSEYIRILFEKHIAETKASQHDS